MARQMTKIDERMYYCGNPYLIAFFKEKKYSVGDEFSLLDYMAWLDKKRETFETEMCRTKAADPWNEDAFGAWLKNAQTA